MINKSKIEDLCSALYELDIRINKRFLHLYGECYLGSKRLALDALKHYYSALPFELIQQKDYLMSAKKTNVFAIMYQIENLINSSTLFNSFILINGTELESLIDSLFLQLPEDIEFLKNKSKIRI